MATPTKAERQETRAQFPTGLAAASRPMFRCLLRLDEETGSIVSAEEKQQKRFGLAVLPEILSGQLAQRKENLPGPNRLCQATRY
jgi:hypothetical protein